MLGVNRGPENLCRIVDFPFQKTTHLNVRGDRLIYRETGNLVSHEAEPKGMNNGFGKIRGLYKIELLVRVGMSSCPCN